jgi:hypothetical protein
VGVENRDIRESSVGKPFTNLSAVKPMVEHIACVPMKTAVLGIKIRDRQECAKFE